MSPEASGGRNPGGFTYYLAWDCEKCPELDAPGITLLRAMVQFRIEHATAAERGAGVVWFRSRAHSALGGLASILRGPDLFLRNATNFKE